MHGAAVVAEDHGGKAGEGGEARQGGRVRQGQEVRARMAPDLLEERGVARPPDQDDLGADLVLDAVADGGEVLGGPDAGRAAAAGMHQQDGARGADQPPQVREVGLAGLEPHFPADERHAGRRQGAHVVFG